MSEKPPATTPEAEAIVSPVPRIVSTPRPSDRPTRASPTALAAPEIESPADERAAPPSLATEARAVSLPAAPAVIDSIESSPTTAAPASPRLIATLDDADAPAADTTRGSELPTAEPLATRETEADDAAVAAIPLETATPRPATPFATVDASACVAAAVRAAANLPVAADVVEDVDTVVTPVAAKPPATDAVRAATIEAVVPVVVEEVDTTVVAAPPAIVTTLTKTFSP